MNEKLSWPLGALLALALAIPAWFLGRLAHTVGEPIFAILLGMILSFIERQPLPGARDAFLEQEDSDRRRDFDLRGSAIAATAPVIEADDREVAFAISTILLFNLETKYS